MKKGTLLRLGLPEFPKTAGTAKEFRDWDLKLEREYPVRFKIYKILKNIYRKLFLFPWWRLRDAIWWVKYRVVPKHKHTTIKLKRIEPGYWDPDTLILYAAFEIFEDFMKDQVEGKTHIKWELTEDDVEDWWLKEDPEAARKYIKEHNDEWKEMMELYTWWTETRPNRENTVPEHPPLPSEWGLLAPFNEDFQDTEEVKEWKRVVDICNKAERDWSDEDQEMLHRLVTIRRRLWD